MAITLLQQQQILDGTVKPPSITLNQLVNLAAMNFALAFKKSYTIFDPSPDPVDPENPTPAELLQMETAQMAQQYLVRMLRACQELMRNESRQKTVNALEQIMVAEIAASEYSWAQIQQANDAAWQAFMNEKMELCIMAFADVRKQEITAYSTF